MRSAEVAGPVLLDTCAAIWLMNRSPLSSASRSAIRSAQTANLGVYLSPFTAWEIGTLVAKGRLHLTLSPEVWFESLLELPGVRLAELTAKLLISSTALPGTPPGDPADRIIAATARLYGYRVITRDSKLLGYAAQGHIMATAC
ncbi:MAG: type II toxin-antitoxin system VapC family toxin [Terracidiphilus sp.]|jgi:PIN domain nuclease of toxin-antitoxin system